MFAAIAAIGAVFAHPSIPVAQITPPAAQSRAEVIELSPGAGVSSNRATVNGVRLHFLRAGSGPAIVVLHGWASTSSMWRNVILKLAEKNTVIAPDMRGYGGSTCVTEWFISVR